MKSVVVILILLASGAHAQNWQEWTQQKETQQRYLQQQIGALQVYISYVKMGYNVVNTGVTTIKKIKDGDFNLHRDVLSRLSGVNPHIKSYIKVADIIAYQLRIITDMKACLRGVRKAGQFSAAELEHCSMVITNLLQSSLENIDALLVLITDGSAKLRDDERIKRIDAIYADMQDKYAFCTSFSNEMGLLTAHRLREARDIQLSKLLNGLQ
jgi:hypothetical protein